MVEGIYYAKAAAFIGAAVAMGLGTIGPALAQGMIGAKSCEAVGKQPENVSQIRSIMIFALIMVETSALYALLVAILLIVFNI